MAHLISATPATTVDGAAAPLSPAASREIVASPAGPPPSAKLVAAPHPILPILHPIGMVPQFMACFLTMDKNKNVYAIRSAAVKAFEFH